MSRFKMIEGFPVLAIEGFPVLAAVLALLAILFMPAEANADGGGGGGNNPTPCTVGMWNSADCDLITVTPYSYTPTSATVQIPWLTPAPTGASISPLQRGTTGTGSYTMRFDMREFGWRMNAICPSMTCGVSFQYQGASPGSPTMEVWVYRGEDGATWHTVNTFMPSDPGGTWASTPTWAVPWWAPTPTGRRTTSRTDEWGNKWIIANPMGTLFSASYPSWTASP